jgi:signal peptide peptidase SppA
MKSFALASPIALIRPQHFAAASAEAVALLENPRCTARAEHDDDEMWYEMEDIYGAPLPKPYTVGTTAIVPIKGVITSGLHPIYRVIGFADTEQIAGWIRAAAADPAIEEILLRIDSPGGMVTGTPELAAAVAAADRIKPVLAHTSGMMDSAAYWIASQARAICCTPSADVGCIGVYQLYYDQSAYLATMGIKASIFKSGDLKAAGHPDIPMTEAQAAHVQAEIDAIGVQFRAAVTARRNIDEDSMRGQSFLGTEALARGLVDDLSTFEGLLPSV